MDTFDDDTNDDTNMEPRIAKPGELQILVFQGGGALGAYQGGVFEELAARGAQPDWVAGISIGAINAALVVGNAPDDRVNALRAFWAKVSSGLPFSPLFVGADTARVVFNEFSATSTAILGAPGFFSPKVMPAWLSPPGSPSSLGLYDTSPLRETLLELVDFDRLNKGGVRLSLGAVNVSTGNIRYFDTTKETIGPEHVMASGALPPGFPPVDIEGELYWDGGLVSNTPLQYVLDENCHSDMLIFQVDLFSASGPLPRTLMDLSEREKDIRFSSRTRLNSDMAKERQRVRRAMHRLLKKLPESFAEDIDARLLQEASNDACLTLVHLINRRRSWSRDSKDYEFSRHTALERWADGVADTKRTLDDEKFIHRQKPSFGLKIFDIAGTDGP